MWPTQPSDHLLGHFDINSTEDEADGTTERPQKAVDAHSPNFAQAKQVNIAALKV